MPNLEQEIAANFRRFEQNWFRELQTAYSNLTGAEETYLTSYLRIASLNAWRSLLIGATYPDGPRAFFTEAQNDAISSHVFARLGSWRAALKFLRSCIENTFYCEYYKDHLIEYRLWESGKHRIGFSEMLTYFRQHPDILNLRGDLSGLDRLGKEYATLSRAVHGSAVGFRMTDETGLTNIWNSDLAKLGSWHTRERRTLTGINLFLLSLHRNSLQGAALPGLRQAVSLTIGSETVRVAIQDELGVSLPQSALQT